MQPPALVDVQSWLLRTIYLRLTSHPHAAYMASCTVMHLIEVMGLHHEATDSLLESSTSEHVAVSETKRRTFWVARALNAWISAEYGKSRVTLHHVTIRLPQPRQEDYTAEFIDLYNLSCCLEPEPDQARWEQLLRQLHNYEVKHDAIELFRVRSGSLSLSSIHNFPHARDCPATEWSTCSPFVFRQILDYVYIKKPAYQTLVLRAISRLKSSRSVCEGWMLRRGMLT